MIVIVKLGAVRKKFRTVFIFMRILSLNLIANKSLGCYN